MAKKSARPPDDAAEERRQPVSVHLTDTERIECQKAAERCGQSLDEWIRERLNRAAKREAKEG